MTTLDRAYEHRNQAFATLAAVLPLRPGSPDTTMARFRSESAPSGTSGTIDPLPGARGFTDGIWLALMNVLESLKSLLASALGIRRAPRELSDPEVALLVDLMKDLDASEREIVIAAASTLREAKKLGQQ